MKFAVESKKGETVESLIERSGMHYCGDQIEIRLVRPDDPMQRDDRIRRINT